MGSAVLNQVEFRARLDDVALNSGTFTYVLNANFSIADNTPFRVRFTIAETNGGMANNIAYTVQFNRNGAGWVAVGLDTFVRRSASSQFANNTATTQIISSGSFVAGVGVTEPTTTNISLSNQRTEVEWCLTLVGVSNDDSIILRVVQDLGVVLNTYTNSPTITAVVAAGATYGVVSWAEIEATAREGVGDDLVRIVAEAMGADEQRSRLVAITRQRSDGVGVGHASLRARSRSRWLVETHGIGEATQRPMVLFRARGDDMAVSEATVSIVEAIGAELLRVVSEALAATEAMARALGLTRRRHEALGMAEAAVRLRALARRRSEMTALAETVRSARMMVRLRSEAATVSETTASVIDAIIAAVVRVVSEVIVMAEMAGRPRHRTRIREETVGLATAVVLIGGILGAAPAAIADRARMVVGAARRLVVRAASRFTVPPAQR